MGIAVATVLEDGETFEVETYLMPLKNGHGFRLLDITNFAAWEAEYS